MYAYIKLISFNDSSNDSLGTSSFSSVSFISSVSSVSFSLFLLSGPTSGHFLLVTELGRTASGLLDANQRV